MQKDKEGRICHVSSDDNINRGHSVCNACGKDMPVVWDVVCCVCRKTFCYDCSVATDWWYCLEHYRARYGALWRRALDRVRAAAC